MPQLGDIYYRVNNYGEYLCLEEYSVVKVTPMGARVSLLLKDGGLQDKKHLIFNRSNNKFAWPDKESAIASFFIRKEYELSHAENRVRSIKTILNLKKMKQ